MARSREMFGELVIIHGDHSFSRHTFYRSLSLVAAFICSFETQSDGQPNYHLGKFANGFLGSLVHFYLG